MKELPRSTRSTIPEASMALSPQENRWYLTTWLQQLIVRTFIIFSMTRTVPLKKQAKAVVQKEKNR
jgi:hypothetical protein